MRSAALRTAFWAARLGEDAGVTHRCYLALTLWHLGFPDQALQLNREMLELARAINQPFSLEYALHHTGWLCQNCRLGVQAQAAGDEQIQIATEQGFGFWHASGTLYAAAGLLLQKRYREQGLGLLQKGLEAYRAERFQEAELHRLKGELLLAESVDWRYLPAATLGGDTLGYHWVDGWMASTSPSTSSTSRATGWILRSCRSP